MSYIIPNYNIGRNLDYIEIEPVTDEEIGLPNKLERVLSKVSKDFSPTLYRLLGVEKCL